MTDTYRWTLDEYVLRHEDSDRLAELVAEGALDRDVFSDALERWNLTNVVVIDSDYVVVTPDDCQRSGYGTGVRSQLLALASALEQARDHRRLRGRVAVIVDRDYDPPPTTSVLFTTDGHSMESYAMNERALGRFAGIGLGRAVRSKGRGGQSPSAMTVSGADLLRRVLPPAVEISALRMSLGSLVPALAPFDRWLRYVSVDETGMMGLDGAKLLHRVLERARRSDEFGDADAARLLAQAQVQDDPFRLVRGHDFISAFHKLMTSKWGARLAGPNVKAWEPDRLARALLLALPSAELDGTPLFEGVYGRFRDEGV